MWETRLNSSKIIQMNPSDITSVQNKTQQITHQEEELMFVMMIKLKGSILDHSFFWSQRQLGMKTK